LGIGKEEKMKKAVTSAVFAAFMIAGVCATNTAAGYDLQRLLLGTSSAGGTYYIMGAGWSNIVKKDLKNVDIACEVTPGGITNVQLIEKGDMDLGMVTAWAAGDAMMGNAWAKEHGPYKKFKSMFPTHSSYLFIFTLKKSGINTIHDLAGKHVSVSTAGSTSFDAGHGILKTLGIKPSRVSELPSGAQLNSIKDGTVDVVFSVTGSPSPWVLDLETTHDVKLIQLADDDIAKMSSAYPFWSVDEIPANTFKNQPTAYKTISFWNFVVASKDVREDVVYDLVKATYAHTKEMLLVDKSASGIKVDNLSKMTVPLHPGALKYYREVGAKIPDKLVEK